MRTDAADPFDLERFVEAQRVNHDEAMAELRAGCKRTHWSWYVFPQLRGLGSSAMAVRYAISGLEEARAYLRHPLLGPRLMASVTAMGAWRTVGPQAVLGEIDARKFHSCCTLFSLAAAPGSAFHDALALHFGGRPDPATLSLLAEPRV